MKELIKKNIKYLVFIFMVMVFGIVGITYAIRIVTSDDISYNISTSPIDVSVTYDEATNGAIITSNGEMMPISDSLVTGPNVTDERVVKAKFKVSGVSTNPLNTIYDISLRDINIDCELRTEEVKWRLYKNNTLLSEGNLSPAFDSLKDNRLVLTSTQEDLTTDSDEYVFLLWISESCDGEIENCDFSKDQSKYLNKSLSGVLKVEVSTKSKKELVRLTGSSESCGYETAEIPIGRTVAYNGQTQVLVKEGTGYTLDNNTGLNAREYSTVATLKSGYKWSDGTTEDKTITSTINKRDVTVTAREQNIRYGTPIKSDASSVNIDNLIGGHVVSSITVTSSITNVGSGTVTVGGLVIADSAGTDVTGNYNIAYKNSTVNIACSNTATEPTVKDYDYDGQEKIGVSGGNNITLSGTIKATDRGDYTASATPNDNYCWKDGSTNSKSYNWKINKDSYTINYDGNGGSGIPDSQTKFKDEPLTLSSVIPEKEGYSLKEWNTKKDGTGTGYTVGGSYTANESVTLYAIWQINTITIKYSVNGGTIDSSAGGHAWTTDSNGIVKKDGSIFSEVYEYGSALTNTGLADYNNSSYINITKTNYKGKNGAEWICLDGCANSNATFNQNNVYGSSDFCDATSSSCSVVLGVNWVDGMSPTLALDKLTYQEGFSGWDKSSSASVDSSNILSLTASSANAKKFFMVDNGEWYVTYDGYTTAASSLNDLDVGSAGLGSGGIYSQASYYNEYFNSVNASNGNNTNGHAPNLPLNTWSNGFTWNGYDGFGTKYVEFKFETGNDSSQPTVKIRNFKFYGNNLYSNFYFIKIKAQDNNSLKTVKYAMGNQTVDYFKESGTAVTLSNGEATIRVTENETYTIYAEDEFDNNVIKTITIDRIDTSPPTITTYAGNLISTDPAFRSGNNGISVYNNSANTNVTITRKAITDAPKANDTGYALEIMTTGSASPGHGGFTLKTATGANKEFLTRIVAKIPVGYSINWASNTIGTDSVGTSSWLTSQEGTGKWEEYVFLVRCGSSGTFRDTNYFYLTGGSTATSTNPITWQVAYAGVLETTNSYKNYIISIANDFGSGIASAAYTTSSGTIPTTWNNVTNSSYGASAYSHGFPNAMSNGTYYVWFQDAAGNMASASVVIDNAATYTVSYNANGGNGAPGSQSKTENVSLTLSSVKPTRAGYTFAGWNTKADGTGTNYAAGGSYTGNNSLILYAKWTPSQYTVTFNANGGSTSTASKSVTYASTYGTLPTPTKEGYNFAGWYTSISGGSQITASSTVSITSNQTLYARWTAIGTPINAKRYLSASYDGTNRTAIYYVTSCDSTYCYYNSVNGLSNMAYLTNDVNYSSITIPGKIAANSITSTINNSYSWSYSMSYATYCYAGANANTEVKYQWSSGTKLTFWRTTTRADSSDNWFYNAYNDCYVNGVGLNSASALSLATYSLDTNACQVTSDCASNSYSSSNTKCNNGQCQYRVNETANWQVGE